MFTVKIFNWKDSNKKVNIEKAYTHFMDDETSTACIKAIIQYEKNIIKGFTNKNLKHNYFGCFSIDDEIHLYGKVKCYVCLFDNVYVGHVYIFEDKEIFNYDPKICYIQGIRKSCLTKVKGISYILIDAILKNESKSWFNVIEPLEMMQNVLDKMGFRDAGMYWIYSKKTLPSPEYKIEN